MFSKTISATALAFTTAYALTEAQQSQDLFLQEESLLATSADEPT
jgi:hypothetical protein